MMSRWFKDINKYFNYHNILFISKMKLECIMYTCFEVMTWSLNVKMACKMLHIWQVWNQNVNDLEFRVEIQDLMDLMRMT